MRQAVADALAMLRQRGTAAVRGAGFIPAIQGLRGISAAAVLIVHIWLIAKHAGMLPWSFPAWLDFTLPTLGQGVNLFFIISGFLIPASLVRHGSTRKFLVDRVLRIMPLFVALHLMVFGLGPLIGYKEFRGMPAGEYVETFLANLFFLPPITGHFLAQQNSWTLTYEWGFYLLVALAFLGLSGRRPLLLGAALLAGALAVLISPFVLYFVLGMGFAFLQVKVRLPRALGWVVWSLSLVLFFYASQYIGSGIGVPLGFLVYGILLDAGSGPARLMSRPVFQYLGRISYSLYLIHPFALFPFAFLARWVGQHGISMQSWFLFYLVAGPVVVFIASELSYRLIEVGLRRRIAGWIDGRAARRLPVTLVPPAAEAPAFKPPAFKPAE